MWILDFFAWTFGALCLILPVVWLFSQTFRFYVKITIYYFCIFMTGQLLMFVVLPYYGDPTNYRFVHWIFITLTRWLHIKWDIRNAERLKSDKPFVVVCNHQSSLDLVGMMECWPDRCVSMMKSSMKYLGFMGIAGMATGSVFIERYNKESAKTTVKKAVEQIKQSQVKIWVFPEGTRNNDGGLLPFKKGAFHLAIQAKIPVVPIVFSSYKPFYDKSIKKFLPEGFVIAQVLPPINTENLTEDDVNDLSVKTRQEMLLVLEKITPEAAEIFENRRF